jgi:hypothetical protein
VALGPQGWKKVTFCNGMSVGALAN